MTRALEFDPEFEVPRLLAFAHLTTLQPTNMPPVLFHLVLRLSTGCFDPVLLFVMFDISLEYFMYSCTPPRRPLPNFGHRGK